MSATLVAPFLDRKATAEFLQISVSRLDVFNRDGKLPRPVMLGSSPRWDPDELTAWMKAGAPHRATWDAMKQKANTEPAFA